MDNELGKHNIAQEPRDILDRSFRHRQPICCMRIGPCDFGPRMGRDGDRECPVSGLRLPIQPESVLTLPGSESDKTEVEVVACEYSKCCHSTSLLGDGMMLVNGLDLQPLMRLVVSYMRVPRADRAIGVKEI